MKALILIIVTVVIEVIMTMIVVKNPEKIIGNRKIDTFLKIFSFAIIALMIITMTYLTLRVAF
jgi:hypothetical protein